MFVNTKMVGMGGLICGVRGRLGIVVRSVEVLIEIVVVGHLAAAGVGLGRVPPRVVLDSTRAGKDTTRWRPAAQTKKSVVAVVETANVNQLHSQSMRLSKHLLPVLPQLLLPPAQPAPRSCGWPSPPSRRDARPLSPAAACVRACCARRGRLGVCRLV